MSRWTLLLRSLTYHRRSALATILCCAVATAVLSGGLVVGDSVKESLREAARRRLGPIVFAVPTGERFVREALADELAAEARHDGMTVSVVPAILIYGAVVHSTTKLTRRAPQVQIIGIDERFAKLAGWSFASPSGREALVNGPLADRLALAAGDGIRLTLHESAAVPGDALFGSELATRAADFTVRDILREAPLADFSLLAAPRTQPNVFVPLATLQGLIGRNEQRNSSSSKGSGGALLRPNQVNLLLVHAPDGSINKIAVTAERLDAALHRACKLEDYDLRVRAVPERGYVLLDSPRVFLEPAVEAAARAAAGTRQLDEVLTYFVTEIRHAEKEVPYSMAAALSMTAGRSMAAAPDPTTPAPFGPWTLIDGTPADDLDPDEVYVNDWTARRLDIRPGDRVTISYYVMGPYRKLETQEHEFRVRGILRMVGGAADHRLMPPFPGLAEHESCFDWDPSVPIDFDKIQKSDEAYWNDYQGTPKVFLNLETAGRLWRNRFGRLTAIRLAPKAGESLAAAAETFKRELANELKPRRLGIQVVAARQNALDAVDEALDFGGLFVGLSFFLLASALALIGLIFRLGVNHRAPELGVLYATGHRVAQVRRLLVAEGGLLALAGGLLGCALAIGYAQLITSRLAAGWSAAVGGVTLSLHVTPAKLLLGLAVSWLTAVTVIYLVVGRLARVPTPALLAGQTEPELGRAIGRQGKSASAWGWGWIVAGVSYFAVGVLFYLFRSGSLADPQPVFFGAGGLLLVGTLALQWLWFSSERGNALSRSRGRVGAGMLLRLSARNARRHPSRSLSVSGLLALASFLLVAVAAGRRGFEPASDDPRSPSGGYALYATSALPIHTDLNAVKTVTDGISFHVTALRTRVGEEASCLNPHKPRTPTLLGVGAEFIKRNAFRFVATDGDAGDNPWTLLTHKRGAAIPVIADQNTLRWSLKLGVGDDFPLTDARGRPRTLRIVGAVSRSVLQGALILSEAHFLELFPGQTGYRTFLIEAHSDADADADAVSEVRAQLEKDLADFGFAAVPTRERLRAFDSVENTYLAAFQALGGLGLMLGTLGLGAVVLRNVFERRAELALLRVLGFTVQKLRRFVVTETLLLLGLGLGCGTLCALVAVWPHIQAQGAAVPWLSLSVTLGVTLLVGLIASFLCAHAALRGVSLEHLRGE